MAKRRKTSRTNIADWRDVMLDDIGCSVVFPSGSLASISKSEMNEDLIALGVCL